MANVGKVRIWNAEFSLAAWRAVARGEAPARHRAFGSRQPTHIQQRAPTMPQSHGREYTNL
jgi:hypothetical protein